MSASDEPTHARTAPTIATAHAAARCRRPRPAENTALKRGPISDVDSFAWKKKKKKGEGRYDDRKSTDEERVFASTNYSSRRGRHLVESPPF
jgi:hypothetical protein